MNSERTESLSPDELIENWNTMNNDEKVEYLTNPSAHTIAILTEFLEEFN